MIKKNDLDQLARHFRNLDGENLLWDFVCYSRQSYAGIAPLNAEDEIMLGLYHQGGGCLCEFGISWHNLNNELVPQLHMFSDAWCLLQTPTIQSVLEQLTQERGSLPTPDDVSAVLIGCGFSDQSDTPLHKSAPDKA